MKFSTKIRKILDAWTEGTVYRIALLKERGKLP